MVAKLMDAAESVTELPHRGRLVPEINQQAYRERFIFNYRMIYRVDSEQVLIVAVIHGHQLLENALDIEHLPNQH